MSGWHLAKLRSQDHAAQSDDEKSHRFAARLGAWVLIAASVVVIITGDLQSKVMIDVQPVKMAAAEGLYETESNAGFSVLTIGSFDGSEEVWALKVPGLLSVMSGHETIRGINDLRADYDEQGFLRFDGTKNQLQAEYAEDLEANYPGIDPIPNIFLSYWTFRLMITLGLMGAAIGVLLLWVTRKDQLPPTAGWWTWLMFGLPLLPLFGNSFGWIFTEMGRQPWIVAGVMPTAAGISPTTSVGDVWISMVVYTLLYGALAVIEVSLLLKYARLGLPDVTPPVVQTDDDAPLSFAY